ncbi:hypothetical protein AVEN_106673-1 [Araneus ventricosus]|uniref:Pre-C2HC domain-containing protein n=1 Tax=Araneus ventricosus TaxID=182803 RepID=A0A4Y2P378_ARAVE|nr:hypothetical protein AVEN_106673-1 [Araneus ventricosus]
MTKRGHSDPIEQAAMPTKTSRKLNLFLADICEAEKAKIAIEHGATQIKVVIDTDKGGCPITTPKKLHTIFDPLLQRDDNYFLTKSKKLILVTNHSSTVDKLLKLSTINDVPIRCRVIENTLSTQYIVRNVDTDASVIEIAEELEKEQIPVLKIVRFTKKDSHEPTPVILIKELGVTSRDKIKLFRCILWTHKYIENPKVCSKCFGFRHFQSTCSKNQKCYKCGSDEVDHNCTVTEKKCIKCHSSDHFVTDFQSCPIYIKEKERINDNDRSKNQQKTSQNHAKVPLASEVVKGGSAQNVHRITSDLSELKEIVNNLKEIVTPLIVLSKIPGFGNDLNNFHSVNQPDTNNLRELNCRLAKEVTDLRAEITRLKFSLEAYAKWDPSSRIDVITTSSDPFLGNGSLDVPLEQDFNLFGGETLVSSDFANG